MLPGLRDLLTTGGLNSLTFSDPYAKLCFTTMLVIERISSLNNEQKIGAKRVIYLDTDTSFTAYLLAGFILKFDYLFAKREDSSVAIASGETMGKHNLETNKKNGFILNGYGNSVDNRLIQVFLPSEGRFESLLGEAIAAMREASILIFDSLNSFYNMYPVSFGRSPQAKEPGAKNQEDSQEGKRKKDRFSTQRTYSDNTTDIQPLRGEPKKLPCTIGRLNHLLSIFIMLLVKHGVYFNIPVLVTSMVRYKKVSEDLWIKSPACRRLLNQKSIVRLSVEMSNERDLLVNVIKHPSIAQKTIVFSDAGIYSAFEVNQSKS